MSYSIKRVVFAVASLGLVSIASIANVSARGISAGAGRAVNGADLTCFGLYYNGVTNNCTTTKAFELALPVDAGGSKSITFGGSKVTCRGQAADQTTGSFASSTPATIGTVQGTASTGTFTMPGAGRMWLSCDVLAGGRVFNANYAQ